MELTTMYESLGVSRAVYEYGEMILDGLRPRFEAIDRTAEYNQTKVLAAMQKNKLSAGCFAATTGYGYAARCLKRSMPTASIPKLRLYARRSPAARTRWPSR